MNAADDDARGRAGCSRLRAQALLGMMLLLIGCSSLPQGQGTVKSRLPPWVTRYPNDPAYYIGVGGAPDTGDPTSDLEHARARALSQLASEIEISIRSDQTFRESASTDGGVSSTADVIVQTLTSQNLEGVELVDSFHSAADGYWFYFRLSKSTWDQIKNKDLYALRDRVIAMIEPLAAPDVTVAERLRSLSSALALLTKSRFSGRISVSSYGGVIDDYIRRRLGATLDALKIEVLPARLRLVPGRPARLRVRVASTERAPIGELPLEVHGPDGQVLAAFVTDTNGLFEDTVRISSFKSGTRVCSLLIAPSILGGVEASVVARAPQPPLEVAVMPIEVHLRLAGPEAVDAAWIAESLTAILTDRFALAIVSADEPTPYSLTVTVRGRNAEPNEYGIAFAYCSLSMSIIKEGLRIAAITTPEVKGAGMTPEQAMRKATSGMLEGLPRDAALEGAIAALVANASDRGLDG